MRARRIHALPARLERAVERFERWRESREGRAIPEALWALAVKLAGEYGSHRTARALRLNSHSLKMRIESAAASDGAAASGNATFLELVPSGLDRAGEYLVEIEDAQGARMRIQCKGVAARDVATVSESFWKGMA